MISRPWVRRLWTWAGSQDANMPVGQDTRPGAPSFDRRQVSLAAMGPIFMGQQTDQAPPNGPATKVIPIAQRTRGDEMQILSPKDCYVLTVAVRGGATLAQGDLILELDSEQEDRTLERLALAQSFLDLQQQAMSDKQIEVRRRILHSTIDVSKNFLDNANVIAAAARNNYRAGQNQIYNFLSPQSAAFRAEAEWKRAQAALDLFEFNVAQARQKLHLALEQIPKEKANVTAQKSRLQVRSPVSGKVELFCYSGSFAAKGAVLAEIS